MLFKSVCYSGCLSNRRSSLRDEDWIESTYNRNSSNQPLGAGTAAQLREWRPQTTVNSMITAQIGVSMTSISQNTNVVGIGNLNSNNSMSGMEMGFMTSRKAMSILPAEQLTTQPNPRKRKSDEIKPPKQKPSQTKQATLKTWITQPAKPPSPPPKTKVRSSGIIQDRGKPSKCTPVLGPLQQSSSPARGYDIDALPSVSFSSPNCPTIEDDDFLSPLPKPAKRLGTPDIPTSPLARSSNPAGFVGITTKSVIQGVSTERKSLGIRRGMKPWPSKKTF